MLSGKRVVSTLLCALTCLAFLILIEGAWACCLTRTPGFWKNHPQIIQATLNDKIDVCGGVDLDTVVANRCDSIIEALCVAPGLESRGNPQLAQLIRQLTAAFLNLQATSNLPRPECGAEIEVRTQECNTICANGGPKEEIAECIADLDIFNRSPDLLHSIPAPFNAPGPAQPRECTKAIHNGILIGASCVVP